MKASARNYWAVTVLFAGILLWAPLPAAGQAPYRFDAATGTGLPARNIGSATMSGRIAAVDAVKEEAPAFTVFVGAASGGVWKSVNGGTTYKPVFDREDVQSIGAVAIDPSNSKIVRVGTGEAWTRNSVSVGDGVYKSTDGGENWTNVGLKDSEHIAKILVNPSDSNNVLACATGHLWDDNDERGVFQTTDGGKTWNKVLAGEWIERLRHDCAQHAGTEDRLRSDVGFPAARLDIPLREGRVAGCLNPLTVARTGMKSAATRGCRRSRGAVWRCRWRRRNRRWCMPMLKRKKEEGCTGLTTAARPGPSWMPATTWCGVLFISAT